MPKGKDLGEDLDRLVAATVMYACQQRARAAFGDSQDYEEAQAEAHQVIDQVLDTIERNLDEDLLERLDRGEYPRVASSLSYWPHLRALRSMWPSWTGSGAWSPLHPLRHAMRRTHDMLDEILEDFRADIEDRLRRARQEERAVSDAEIDEALQALKEDLSVVVRRARRREDRRDDDGTSRRRRTARESRTA